MLASSTQTGLMPTFSTIMRTAIARSKSAPAREPLAGAGTPWDRCPQEVGLEQNVGNNLGGVLNHPHGLGTHVREAAEVSLRSMPHILPGLPRGSVRFRRSRPAFASPKPIHSSRKCATGRSWSEK